MKIRRLLAVLSAALLAAAPLVPVIGTAQADGLSVPPIVLELMERVGSQHFRMYWQPNQLRSREVNLAYAEKLAGYTDTIHVFNWRGTERFPLSEGLEAWRQYLQRFSGNETLLLEFMPDDSLDSLPAETDALFHLSGGVKQ